VPANTGVASVYVGEMEGRGGKMFGDHDAMLTMSEFCRDMGITVRTFHNWQNAGKTPPIIRNGRWVRIRQSAARQWLTDRESQTA
jgi:predicted DNA-binding transcriptional regulator AlpA